MIVFNKRTSFIKYPVEVYWLEIYFDCLKKTFCKYLYNR